MVAAANATARCWSAPADARGPCRVRRRRTRSSRGPPPASAAASPVTDERLVPLQAIEPFTKGDAEKLVIHDADGTKEVPVT